MKLYYYADNDQQFGPFTIEELKTKRLKKTVLVWTDGMEEWASAQSIEELKDILISVPPPLPKSSNPQSIDTSQNEKAPITQTSSEYDLSYENENDATFVGVILLVIPIVFKLVSKEEFEIDESYISITIVSIVLRIIITIWVVNIASRQNRNTTSWGIFAFFLPSISLIIIGQLKKLRLSIELDASISANQQAEILLNKANGFYDNKRYLEVIEILNKAIEIDSQNFECIKLRGLTYYNLKNYQLSKSDFEFLNDNKKFPDIVYYYLGNFEVFNYRIDDAIGFWQKSKENNNEIAQSKLDQFYTFTGNYLLDTSNTIKKLGINLKNEYLYFETGKYLGGISHIDQNENVNNLHSVLRGFDNGLEIELKKRFTTYHIAIAFYEIEDIVFNIKDKIIEIHLFDKIIVTLSYDHTVDNLKGLNYLCNSFKKLTGKTSSALNSLS